MTAIGMKNPIINSISSALVYSTSLMVMKLIASCLIHGMVYEKIESLLLSFDELDVSLDRTDENIHREVTYFKSQILEPKFGFTIAGLMPFKKMTLLSVSHECVTVKTFL